MGLSLPEGRSWQADREKPCLRGFGWIAGIARVGARRRGDGRNTSLHFGVAQGRRFTIFSGLIGFIVLASIIAKRLELTLAISAKSSTYAVTAK